MSQKTGSEFSELDERMDGWIMDIFLVLALVRGGLKCIVVYNCTLRCTVDKQWVVLVQGRKSKSNVRCNIAENKIDNRNRWTGQSHANPSNLILSNPIQCPCLVRTPMPMSLSMSLFMYKVGFFPFPFPLVLLNVLSFYPSFLSVLSSLIPFRSLPLSLWLVSVCSTPLTLTFSFFLLTLFPFFGISFLFFFVPFFVRSHTLLARSSSP